MDKQKLFSSFQKLGKVLMAPVLLLPISGILVGVGSAFTNASLVKVAPFLANDFFSLLFQLMKDAGNVVNNNISIIFAICIAYGYAKSEKATAALSGFLGYMTMNTVMGSFLIARGIIDTSNLLTGQKAILGVVTLDTGVFGGIIIGLIVSYLHNKYYKIQLPPVLGIFNGTRFIPAITIIVASFVGIALSFVFPPIQNALQLSSEFINSTGVFGAFVYGFAERILLPFGLHHFIYLPFFFTSLGGVMEIGGQTVEGAVNIYNAILNTPGAMFDINISRYVMNGKVLFAMFGLVGAALAIYKTAHKQNRKKVASLMIAAVIPCALMGITEPLEYSFLFVAPILFGVHALLSGIAYILTYIVSFNIAGPSAFGGPLLSWIFNGILNADKGSNWYWLLILGPIYFVIYYYVFKFVIIKFDLKTPGREVQESKDEIVSESCTGDLIPRIVEAVGGKENILKVEACFTRLRLSLKDKSIIKPNEYFKNELSANGIVKVADGVQIIYGNKASVYKTEMREFLGLE
ncbi:PTS transporter subunit EIIC [Clostridium tertium]|jgi:PTS system maltose and glucose-specific IIC component|uniref:PTS transporter subunit EIIC n=1 Tax=Clostridium TaxID=1485 RepID=UPI000DD08040|nr:MULTISPECIES: PTS transporter subunit EIIC [Clostridium]MBU6134676.1 PTS transporter subunit EIIC [Clostridium tertium]MDB1939405.1 PTS transporter subunit EIIC [Clostridium tertium]MDB1953403.1 PTS transporter subunit EIIC [Clostridium tertium]MDB1957932.1 PTS transporter subunit EIIC [Clostridium tertium]MDB1961757.1 PTS transporter subunit EIIC [Clostridium tertium]